MKKIHIVCEGQTEEAFVNKVIKPHLFSYNLLVFPHILIKRGQPGGDVKYVRLLADIKRVSKNDGETWTSCLIDFYGIGKFPKLAEAECKTVTMDRYDTFILNLLEALRRDLTDWQLNHFIPYIQMHEFEALLFSNTEKLAGCFFAQDDESTASLITELEKVKQQFHSVEDINNSRLTAPSKRIEKIYPAFQKTLHGVLAAEDIGMRELKNNCPLFKAWIEQLERLGNN